MNQREGLPIACTRGEKPEKKAGKKGWGRAGTKRGTLRERQAQKNKEQGGKK